MMLSRLMAPLAAVAISLAASASITGAAALPLPGAAARPVADAGLPVELAHGCHRGIQRDYGGWHFHTRACVRRPTAPPGLYDNPAYRRFYRGPVCSYRCRFIGPVKTCQQVCR
jgi:hypothetical protein